uniref:Uncharacterized protein n=1 Tax=Lactuca sativa TaxID=4236 RepID=A0A9R1VCL9_LACSA|nr:hypothetical protein LSAT_V11C600306110 [Lactuca sativa]
MKIAIFEELRSVLANFRRLIVVFLYVPHQGHLRVDRFILKKLLELQYLMLSTFIIHGRLETRDGPMVKESRVLERKQFRHLKRVPCCAVYVINQITMLGVVF